MANKLDKKLDNTIIIGEDRFTVTAETPNPLVINKVNLCDTDENPNTTKVVDFNGSVPASLDLVTANGGRFRKRIAVPPDIRDTIDDEAVLNYGDIRDKVLNNLLNTSVLYRWDGKQLNPTVNNAIVGISLITGSESNLTGFAIKNKNSKQISAYLYICTDTNNIYFGTSDENTARRLATEATELSLTKPISLNVDLESEDTIKLDGSTEGASLGVTGKLPMSHGGLGGNLSTDIQVAKMTEYYVNGSIDSDDTAITDSTWMLFGKDDPSVSTGWYCRKTVVRLWAYIANRIKNLLGLTDGVLPPVHGGTGEANLDNVTVGKSKNSEKLNGQTASYYQKKITVSNSEPSGGSVGDIWIVYK